MIESDDWQFHRKEMTRALTEPSYAAAHKFLLLLIILVGIVDIALLPFASFHLNLAFLARIIPILIGLLLLEAFYLFRRPRPFIAWTVLATIELLLFTLVCGILSYLLIGLDWPWRDVLYVSWDRAFGFDWIGYKSLLERHRLAYALVFYLYQSVVPQIVATVIVLGLSGRIRTLTEFVAMIVVGGILTVVIGAVAPAEGAYSHFNIPDHGIITYHADTVAAHDRSLMMVDPLHLEGLVAFPSYHTYLAVALIIVGWQISYLRYAILSLNVLLLIGVPTVGGHYFVDVLAGALLSVAVVLIWRYMMEKIFSIVRHGRAATADQASLAN